MSISMPRSSTCHPSQCRRRLPRHTRHPPAGLISPTRTMATRAIRTAMDMIQSAAPGTRHHAQARAARLLGGYVRERLLRYAEALSGLVEGTRRLHRGHGGALKTVVDGLAYGEAIPHYLEDHWKPSGKPGSSRIGRRTTTRQAPAEDDPWEGRRTLPLKPYEGLRLGRTVRRG